MSTSYKRMREKLGKEIPNQHQWDNYLRLSSWALALVAFFSLLFSVSSTFEVRVDIFGDILCSHLYYSPKKSQSRSFSLCYSRAHRYRYELHLQQNDDVGRNCETFFSPTSSSPSSLFSPSTEYRVERAAKEEDRYHKERWRWMEMKKKRKNLILLLCLQYVCMEWGERCLLLECTRARKWWEIGKFAHSFSSRTWHDKDN